MTDIKIECEAMGCEEDAVEALSFVLVHGGHKLGGRFCRRHADEIERDPTVFRFPTNIGVMLSIEDAAKAFVNGLSIDDRYDDSLAYRAFIAGAEMQAKLWPKVEEQFIVCYAAGYPDPYSPWPNTPEEAIKFRDEHRINGVTGKPMDPQPVVKRRLMSAWEVVAEDQP